MVTIRLSTWLPVNLGANCSPRSVSCNSNHAVTGIQIDPLVYPARLVAGETRSKLSMTSPARSTAAGTRLDNFYPYLVDLTSRLGLDVIGVPETTGHPYEIVRQTLDILRATRTISAKMDVYTRDYFRLDPRPSSRRIVCTLVIRTLGCNEPRS
jgi:hypothetical protein